jgi:hypothetical protein
MKAKTRGFTLAFLAALLILSTRVDAARQVVALFPPELNPAAADNVLLPALPILEKALQEKLKERFDVRSASSPVSVTTEERMRSKARSIGASYILTGTLSRIGKGVTLDVTLAPVEDSGKGRTVVVSGVLEDASPVSSRYSGLFRWMGTDAALRVNELFFGSGQQAAAAGMGRIPTLEGMINRSAPLPGEVVSVAKSDLNRDGKVEIVAAYASELAIYRLEGDDLREDARIPEAGPGLFHVDAADIDRDGMAEIMAGRFIGRKAVSDIWRFDGKGYRRIAADLPYFLRTVDLGPEGIVLLGQETDSRKIYRGPVFRMSFDASGSVGIRDRERPLPLPDGTFIHGFIPLRRKDGVRFAVLSARDRLVYLDSSGKEIWEGLDAFNGTEIPLSGINENIRFPGRMVAVDLNRDGNDELVVMNILEIAGVFFEKLRIPTQAELVCFTQAGDSMQLAWRSPQTGTSAQDLLLDRDRYGIPRFGLASRDRGKILGGAAEWRILWMK